MLVIINYSVVPTAMILDENFGTCTRMCEFTYCIRVTGFITLPHSLYVKTPHVCVCVYMYRYMCVHL